MKAAPRGDGAAFGALTREALKGDDGNLARVKC